MSIGLHVFWTFFSRNTLPFLKSWLENWNGKYWVVIANFFFLRKAINGFFCEVHNACTLVPTVFRWHGKREFKCHFHFSFSHDIEQQIWVLLFVFHFRLNFEKRFCTSYFVFRFRITLRNGYHFQFSSFVFAARSDKNVCKITMPRENGNVYHRVTALLIPRSGRQRPGFLAYPPPSVLLYTTNVQSWKIFTSLKTLLPSHRSLRSLKLPPQLMFWFSN